MSIIWDDNGHPFATDQLPRRIVVLRGRWKGKRKPAESVTTPDEVLMCELAPRLQSDIERGEGDSINSRMHRLIGGGQ